MRALHRAWERARGLLERLAKSDEAFLLDLFEKHHGYRPDLARPRTFNEKMQWRKLYDANPLYTLCSDKVAVRDFVAERVGAQRLIPALGVFDDARAIDFAALPASFVIKGAHGSGWVRLVRDKDSCDLRGLVRRCNRWLERDYSLGQRERHYRGIPRRLLVEALLLDAEGEVPKDYKLHCFNRPGARELVVEVDSDRFTDHRRDFYDTDWNHLDLEICYPRSAAGVARPAALDELREVARALSEPFAYVRVDLYAQPDRVYFGELTFVHGAGFERFTPASADLEWGEKVVLPSGAG